VQLLKAQADTPQLVAADASFNQMQQRAMAGNNTEGVDINAHLLKYNQFIQDKKFDDAQKELDQVQKAARNANDLATKMDPALQPEQDRLTKAQADLGKRTDLNDQEKAVEKTRLDNAMALVKQQLNIDKQQENFFQYTQYLRGYCDYSRGDKESAHALFEQVKDKCPELANNKELHLDELLEATKKKGVLANIWDHVKEYAIPVLAFAAAAGAAALTFWSGPGA